MRTTHCLSALMLLVVLSGAARAAAPWPLYDGHQWRFPKLCELWEQRHCWCPDDYCRKPLPVVLPNAKGCCDDYCSKPLPCVTANPVGCVDDYCPKCCPLMLWPIGECWYRCGPDCHQPLPAGGSSLHGQGPASPCR